MNHHHKRGNFCVKRCRVYTKPMSVFLNTPSRFFKKKEISFILKMSRGYVNLVYNIGLLIIVVDLLSSSIKVHGTINVRPTIRDFDSCHLRLVVTTDWSSKASQNRNYN